MASDGSVCLGPIFFLIGLFMIYGTTLRFLLYQKINNTPTSKVRSAAVGLVELSGKALCQQEIESPVSKAKCVYWKLKGEYYQSGKNGGWRTLFTKNTSSQFFLEDDTGKMLVEPKSAEIEVPIDFQSTGYLTGSGFLGMQRTSLDPKVIAYLDTDVDARSRFNSYSGHDLRVTEYYIAEDDPLFVFGDAMPRDGASSSVGFEDLTVQIGRDKVMFISDSNEYKALETIRNSFIVSLVIGLVLSAIGLYVILSIFGV